MRQPIETTRDAIVRSLSADQEDAVGERAGAAQRATAKVRRYAWLAFAVSLLLVALFFVWGEDHPVLTTASVLVGWGIGIAVLIRFGLFALVVTLCTNSILHAYFLTTHLSAWYAEPTFFVFFVFLAAAIFGFYTSTAGKPLFSGISIDN